MFYILRLLQSYCYELKLFLNLSSPVGWKVERLESAAISFSGEYMMFRNEFRLSFV